MVLSRSGPTAHRKEFSLGDARRQQLVLLPPLSSKAAEGIHEDRGGQPRRRTLPNFGRKFLRPPVIDPPGSRICADQVVFQHCLKIGLLPDLLEERQADLGIVDGDIARTEDGPAPPFPMTGAKACSEEPQGAACALEVRNSRPPLAHEINQGRMEWIGRADTVAQGDALLLGLLLLRRVARHRPGASASRSPGTPSR